MRESVKAFVVKFGNIKGLKVLDLGGGDGTKALHQAKAEADVLVADIATNLVAIGSIQTKAAGLDNCVFCEGDATNLQELTDNSFDLTISIFGAMFTPKPYDVAKKMVRVTKTG